MEQRQGVFVRASLYRLKKVIWALLFRGHTAQRFEPFLPRGGIVLDIGSGLGDRTSTLSSRDRLVIGVEPSPAEVKYAKSKHPTFGYVVGSGYSLPFRSRSFDAVTMIDVVHHLKRPADVISEATRVANQQVLIADICRLKGRVLKDLESLWLRVTDGGFSYFDLEGWHSLLGPQIQHEERYGTMNRAALFVVRAGVLQEDASHRMSHASH
jgi:SAM-dependent methyltransferase